MAGIATIENVGLSRARLKCTAEVDNLAGCRVLVLEDEYSLASDLEQELTARGAIVVGPFAEISKTKDQVANGGFDVAVIDIDLRGEPSFSIADELIRRRIPFIFVTGYSPRYYLSAFNVRDGARSPSICLRCSKRSDNCADGTAISSSAWSYMGAADFITADLVPALVRR
jgi:hypothetical protein